ncbi:DEAD/DEAH box helicase family protein, partial [Candidatus Dependentiae bacterium]|nr:DEAD/DEAH box helicase family protein [Candidatus Dependentiae bacterium]
MNREAIINYVGDRRIFWRGESYYETGKIVSFTKTGNKIRAFSLGSRNRRYSVEIEFHKDGGVKTAYCSCPYYRSGYICKHIAAVLIYYCEEYFLSSPIIKDEKEFKDEKEITFLIETDGFYMPDDPLSEISNELSVTEKDLSTDKYRLVFRIGYLHQNYHYSDNWTIKPALQYKKKNGDYGKLRKYKKNNLTMECTELEMSILNKIDIEHHHDLFRTYIKQIKEHRIPTYIDVNYKSFPITFVPIKEIEIQFRIYNLNEVTNEYYFTPNLIITDDNDIIYDVELLNEIIIDPFNIWIINDDGKIFYKENDKPGYLILKYILKKNESFSASQIERIKKLIKKNKVKFIKINFNQKSIKISYPIPKPYIEIEERTPKKLYFNLMFDYVHKQVKPIDRFGYIIFYEGEEVRLCKRNMSYEDEIKRYIGNRFSKITGSSNREYHVGNMKLVDFLIKYGEAFLNEGIELRVGGERVKDSKRGRIAYRVTSGIDWFEVEAKFIDEDKNELEVDFDLMNMKDGILRVGDTFLVLNKADIKKLKILKEEGLNVDGKLKVSKYNFQVINELYNNIINNQDSEIKRIQMIYKKLTNFTKIKNVKIPKGLKGKLRDYQYAGLTWLNFLHQYNLNGCLADDMGLGKTIQALSLLLKLKEKKKKSTSLIVVPVSTILNWENEIRKFAPSLTYTLHYGLQRTESIDVLKKYDIIISSYHTLRNDILLLNKMKYHYIILDESQYIKNSSTQIFKAIRSLTANNRLTLTGTPIENNTLELWSQMEFLNPTLLGSRREFIKKFTKPIEA